MGTAVAVKIDTETKDRMKRLATAKRRSTHWLMKEAIGQYIEREEKRESFRQDALKAWDEYQATGLQVTMEETDAWLASWGTENELPVPVCHK